MNLYRITGFNDEKPVVLITLYYLRSIYLYLENPFSNHDKINGYLAAFRGSGLGILGIPQYDIAVMVRGDHHSNIVLRGLRGHLNWYPICGETSVSGAADGI